MLSVFYIYVIFRAAFKIVMTSLEVRGAFKIVAASIETTSYM